MKLKLIAPILLLPTLSFCQCYDWAQKASLLGTSRESAVGFSIGTKGYIGTGKDSAGVRNDFWEYDPTANSWTQKANFGGIPRWFAVGFSIGAKGYIGTGHDGSFGYLGDFWEYNPSTNAWIQKANFGGGGRHWATGFSIGNKGYIGTGYDPALKSDLWEYNPATDSWIQKSNFPGTARCQSVSFSIGTKGYIGTGTDAIGMTKDFWEWNQTNDTWTQKADFGGAARAMATAFSIGQKGYIGLNGIDFWEWNQSTNLWTQVANYGGIGVGRAVGFSIGTKGYAGTGLGAIYYKAFWEYSPAQSKPYEICISTVDSLTSTKNIVVWNKPVATTIDSFRIYRETASVFKRIASVPYGSVSLFTDSINGVDPRTSPYKYKISTIDTGGVESILSNPHETMWLQVSQTNPPTLDLVWTEYCGFPYTTYSIYRDSTYSNSWELINTVSFGTNAYVDSFPPNDSSRYRIEAFIAQPCTASIKNIDPMSTTVKGSKSNSDNKLHTPMSVDNISNDKRVKVYPNPNRGTFSVESLNQIDNLTIYNIYGCKVFSKMINDKLYNIQSNFPKGIYFLRIDYKNGNEIKKIIIE